MMELKLAIEDDLTQSLQYGENEAKRSIEQVMEEFKKYSEEDRKVISRTYLYLAHSLNDNVFTDLSAPQYRRYNDQVLSNLELYESNSMVGNNPAIRPMSEARRFSANMNPGSIVSDLSESVHMDSSKTAIPEKLNLKDPLARTDVQKHPLTHDSTEIVAQFKEFFEGNKKKLVVSKVRKLLKQITPELYCCLNSVAPDLLGHWKLLTSLPGDETLLEPKRSKHAPPTIPTSFKRFEQRNDLENLLFSKYVLKDIQEKCSGATFEAVSTVGIFSTL
jgi:hypothetical protein